MGTLIRRFRARLQLAGYFGAVALLAAVVAIFSIGAGLMVDSQAAIRAAEGLGLRDARIVGENRFFAGLSGCSKDDAAAFDVRAVNAQGETVDLTVCVGWPFKGATPRFD